jgi:RNA polymerase sigma factor (sigma-70 family)
MTNDDSELLRRYAAEHSEAAFAELVRRHVDLVYSAALRLVNGDSHRAQDLTQQVFSELARHAKSLARHPTLVGWLYTTTRQMAWRAIRSETRRAAREHMASTMNDPTHPSAPEPEWEHLQPVLDDAMHQLNDTDRLAVLLRFFKNKSLREVGLELNLTENAARMRVERALEKLRLRLARKGVTSTSSALALALTGNAVNSAPAAFTAALAGASLTGAASQAATTLGILKLMAATKLKIGLAALVIAGAAVVLINEHQAWLSARADNDALRQQIAQLKSDNDTLSNRLSRLSRSRSQRDQTEASKSAANTAADSTSAGGLRARLIANPTHVEVSQLQSYLAAHHRDAASLLAAYRVTHDPAMLQEAMQNFPNDPKVDFEAALQTNSTPADRRQWLAAFEKSAPDNALPNYLSALAAFQSGQPAQAMQEMAAASAKPGFQDYSTDRLLDDREAYLASGSTLAEAEISSATQLMLPQLLQLKQLGGDLVNLSQTYAQSGDTASAQSALQMEAALGARYATAGPAEAEISQLVGMTLERQAFSQMDPSTPYGDTGQTVQDQINQLTQQRTTLDDLNQQAAPYLESMTDQDYLTYKDRWMAFGEEAALRWVIGKYGQQ